MLGKRGMNRVHLVDAGDAVGGRMREVAAYPNLGEWGRVTGYRQIQLERLANVDVILKQRLSAEQVLTYGAEIVVVATGSRWRGDGMNGPTQAPIPGAGQDFVHTPEAVAAAGGEIEGERVLVYDTDGYFTAVAMAQLLLGAGKQVTLVTPFANFAQYMFLTGEGFRVNRELRAAGARVVAAHVLTEIGAGVAAGQEIWAPDPVSWEADAVVLVTQREPVDSHLPRADRRPRPARGRGDRGGPPDRRLRRAAADRRMRLRRPAPRSRDRLAGAGAAAALPARGAGSAGEDRRRWLN